MSKLIINTVLLMLLAGCQINNTKVVRAPAAVVDANQTASMIEMRTMNKDMEGDGEKA